MKLSFTTLGCPDWSREEIAARAKPMGFDGVELRTHADGNHFSPDAAADEAKRVAEQFRSAGAPIASLMGYTTFAHADPAKIAENQALMRKLIGLAAAMGVPFIRTFAGQLPKGADREAVVAAVIGALKPLAADAAARGVTIAVETHDDWCAGALVRRVADGVGTEGFGIVYDVFNAFVAGLEPLDVTYAAIRPRLAYCHLKDGWRDREGKVHYVALGAGDLPVADLLGRLKADGYAGWLSFEWEKKWHPELDAPERAFPHFAHKVRALLAS